MSFIATTRTGALRGQQKVSSVVSSSTAPVSYVRVLDVILTKDHEQWETLGGTQCLYGVFYQNLYKADMIRDKETESFVQFAYCFPNTFRRVPIPGEIVTIRTEITAEGSDNQRLESSRTYWDSIVPVWNSPHLNLYPDKDYVLDVSPFEESDKVLPVQLCLGDVSLEGRHGQVIRLGGTQSDKSPIAVKDSNNKPYITIVTGLEGEEQPEETRYEDINRDATSIYLVSDHKVPLEQAHSKRKGWKDLRGPTKASEYKGKQILANSSRIYLNARDLDIELSAKESIGLNSKIVAFDADDYVGLDAKKIYLGTNSFSESEPCLKGKTTTNWLSDLSDQLKQLLQVMSKPSPPVPWVSSVAAQSSAFLQVLISMKERLPQLHSKKIFVE